MPTASENRKLRGLNAFPTRQVAVIGAGMAGARCAQVLVAAGHAVQVFDKSRGPGGRLATRRLEWRDRRGLGHTTRLDHGAVSITAASTDFQAFLDEAVRAGGLAEWQPVLAPGSLPLPDAGRHFVPVPEQPALCRTMLAATTASWSFAADKLHRGPLGWQVSAGDTRHPALFDAVVLALPPAQAAALLNPHRPDWAARAAAVPMQPCWTLMGIAQASEPNAGAAPAWDLARPASGCLAWVLRNDSRPGRDRVPGQAHWVVHAQADWSQQNLEQDAEAVRDHLQAALAGWLGRPVDWLHAVAHRWRYALPPTSKPPGERCWWDAALGLGVCGDFLGRTGAEGAWLSAQALCAAMQQGIEPRHRRNDEA